MIIRAALCPSAPLLAPGVTGQTAVLSELREACDAAVAWLLAAAPDAVTVIGPATATAAWPPESVPDLSTHVGPPRPAPTSPLPLASPLPPGAPLPLALAIGAQLLDAAGYSGPRILQSVAESASPEACRDLGRDLAVDAPLTALLVIGDGSARRSAAAPGYLDDRAEPFDTAVEQALRDGDLPALAALDPYLARDLLAAGRPAWQVLAGALATAYGPSAPQAAIPETTAPRAATPAATAPVNLTAPARPRARVLYSAAPFGVAYLVATLDPAASK